MNEFRFSAISIVPQYAMSALNPTRKIGAMIAELLGGRATGGSTSFATSWSDGSPSSGSSATSWTATRSSSRAG